MFNFKFLAVLDDGFFQNSAADFASRIQNFAEIVWYRVKNENINYENIKAVRKAVSKCLLVISSDFDTAVKYGYDGVHLNSHSIHNYRILQENHNLLTGYSSHSIKEIENIKADYYTLSPVYDTPKDYKVSPVGFLDYNKSKKVFGLGGVNLSNIEKVCSHYYGGAGIRIIKEILEKYYQ